MSKTRNKPSPVRPHVTAATARAVVDQGFIPVRAKLIEVAAFLDRVEPVIRGNFRMAQPLAGLRRLSDREQVVDQERHRTGL